MRLITTLFLASAILAGCTDDSKESTPSTPLPDSDGDGYYDDADCAPDDAAVSPGAPELCNGQDDDCDGDTDEIGAADGISYFADADADSFGDVDGEVVACAAPDGYVADSTDCDDDESAVNPSATEVCDDGDTDENCDGAADDDSATGKSTFYLDGDADGYGVDGSTADACDVMAGYAADTGDCDDVNASANPGAAEVCDAAAADEDCDGLADDADDSTTGQTTWYADPDGDGLGSSSDTLSACSQPTGYVDTPAPPTVYDDLGGAAAIDAVLDAFLANVAADTTINWMFANSDLANLKLMLADQICEATGGGCVYTGGDMATVHAEMAITDDQFNALVGDLLLALDSLAVPYTAGTFDGGLPADTLILALAGMQSDIVTDPLGDTVLFNQLGGHAAVSAVVDGLIANIALDSRINGFFASTDLVALDGHLVNQICEATGGYCTYTGRSMCDVHDGMGVTESDFDALVEDLLLSLDSLGVAYTAGTFDGGLPADSLILALAAMEGEVLGTDCGTSTETVYDGLGGAAGVDAVLDEFLANVGADANINWMFANADLGNLKTMLADQICEATGGGCVYTGGDMVTVHANMAITDAQFGYLVGDLLTAMDTLGVPYTAGTYDGGLPADTLILTLAGMQPDIVTDAAADTVLFNQLGGYAAVSAVVDGMLSNVAANSEINWMFVDTDLANLDTMLVNQICETTGGYCVYAGGDMVTVHADMAITDAQFNELVGDLLLSLDSLGVPYTAGTYDGGLPADSLILALAAMQPDIVTDPAGDIVNFNQIGGHAALEAVMDQFLLNVAADARINGFFAATDLVVLDELLVEQTCEATGGYCTYSGRSMCDTHAGMGVTTDDFNALVEDLLDALDTLGVPYALDGSQPIDALLFTLLAMEGEVTGTDCTP